MGFSFGEVENVIALVTEFEKLAAQMQADGSLAKLEADAASIGHELNTPAAQAFVAKLKALVPQKSK